MKPELTAERLREILGYDPDSGIFIWKQCGATAKRREGTIAGGLTDEGYWRIYALGWPFKAHRLAFLYQTGAWPRGEVDHINGMKADNRWSNLRDATAFVNQQNKLVARSDNRSSGLLGVTWNKRIKRFQAQIWVRGKITHLGYFDDPEQGHQAYLCAKRRLHEGCTI